MFKTVIIGDTEYGIPRDTPNQLIAAIPDLSGAVGTSIRIITHNPGYEDDEIVLPRHPCRDAPPPVNQATVDWLENIIERNEVTDFDQIVEDHMDSIVIERIETATDLVLSDIISDHIDDILDASVKKAAKDVLAEYLE